MWLNKLTPRHAAEPQRRPNYDVLVAQADTAKERRLVDLDDCVDERGQPVLEVFPPDVRSRRSERDEGSGQRGLPLRVRGSEVVGPALPDRKWQALANELRDLLRYGAGQVELCSGGQDRVLSADPLL